MWTILATAALALVSASSAGAGDNGADGWVWIKPGAGKAVELAGSRTGGYESRLKLTSESSEGLSLRLIVEGARAREVAAKGGTFTELDVPGSGVSGAIGSPRLPALRRLIEAPAGAEVSVSYDIVRVQGTSLGELGLVGPLMPVQAPIPKVPGARRRAPFMFDPAAYAVNDFAPADPVVCRELGVARGHRLLLLEILPIAYNPVTGGLIIHWKLDVTVSFIVGAEVPTTGCSPTERALAGLVLNSRPAERGEKGTARLLIISSPGLYSAADTFGTAEAARGLDVLTVSTDTTGTTTTAIQSYIRSRYDNASTRPDYLLLVGDTDTIPHWTGQGYASPPTDLYYACMDGAGDWMPDIAVGRWAVSTAGQLSNIVDKTTYYENGSFVSTEWIKKAVFMASSDNYTVSEGTHNSVISTYLEPRGYTSDKLYCVTYGATTGQVTNAFNNGRALGIYSGHGGTTYWADGPEFTQANVNALTNSNIYPFVCSFACITGDYTASECFAETWIRATNGAVGILASSESSYWDEDDILERRLFSAVYDAGCADFGEAIVRAKALYLLHYGETAELTRAYFEQYNLFGTPAAWLPTQLLAVDVFEPDDTPAQAKIGLTGRHGPHSIYPVGDADYVTFTLPAAADVVIETLGPPGGGDTTLVLYDAAETPIASDNDSGVGKYSKITYASLPAGTYYAAARENGNNGTIREYYIEVSAGEGDLYEPDNEFCLAPSVATNVAHGPHTISPVGDVDMVSFTLDAQADVIIETSGSSGGDTIMYLYDVAEALLASDDDSGTDSFSRIEQPALAAGTYFVVVKESGQDDTVPDYYITVSMPTDAYEPDGTWGQATAISLGDNQGPHSIDPETDLDWVTFTLATTTDIVLETSGPAGGDTVLYLYDSSLTLVDSNDDIDLGGGNYYSRIMTELAAGTYYAKVESYDNSELVPDYYICLSEGAGGDDFEPDDTAAQASTLTSGVAHGPHSCYPDNDIDYMVFTLSVTSDITVETSGPDGDTYMYLLDSSETVIEENDDGGSGYFSLISATDLPAGTYYVAVRDYYYGYLEEYWVTLTVSPHYPPLDSRVSSIAWSNNCQTATVTYEANQPVQRYYYRLYQLGPTYTSSASPVAQFDGLGDGYYLFVGTSKTADQEFQATPCRAWFINKTVGTDYQVYLESYTINHDAITFNLAANRPTNRYYVRLYSLESGYTANTTGVVTYSGLDEGLYYFVATGREAATQDFPPGGPLRQYFYIRTDGFQPTGAARGEPSPKPPTSVAVTGSCANMVSHDAAATVVDSDGDGLTDAEETSLGLDPASADTDRDGIPDAVDPEVTPILEVFPNVALDGADQAELLYEVAFELDAPALVHINAAACCDVHDEGADALSLVATLEREGLDSEVMTFEGAYLAGAIAACECALELDAGRYTLRFFGTGSPALYWVKVGYVPSDDRLVLDVPEGLRDSGIALVFALETAGSVNVRLAAGGEPASCAVDGEPSVPATTGEASDGTHLFEYTSEELSASEHAVELTLEQSDLLYAVQVRRIR